MSNKNATHSAHSFGDFTLDVDRGALMRNGKDIKLRPQAFAVLKFLVERNGTLVSKRELMDTIWRDRVVTEGSLAHCLIDIRKAIDDSGHRILRTVPRRGYIFDLPVDHSDIPGPAVGSGTKGRLRPTRPDWALRTVFVVFLGIAAVWWVVDNHIAKVSVSARSESSPDESSIAVLPFVDMSAEKDQQYLGDGISEEILNLLAQSPSLQVIARTSSFSFDSQGVGISKIAQQLNVSYILEGSVRNSGKTVRVTAQLVDGSTGMHVWSQIYDRELNDILGLQSEIATAITTALRVELPAFLPARLDDVQPEAYQAFLKAQFFYNRGGPGDTQKAEAYYQAAIDIDPDFARAWAGLAACHVGRLVEEALPKGVMLTKARRAVDRALALDPGLAEAHIRAAHIHVALGDSTKADEHYRLAGAIDPGNSLVLGALGGKAALEGRVGEAIEMLGRAVAVDPLKAVHHANLSTFLLANGHIDAARKELGIALELSPAYRSIETDKAMAAMFILEENFDEALLFVNAWPDGDDKTHCLALIYHGLGMPDDADDAIKRLSESQETGISVRLAEIHAYRGQLEESVRWLQDTGDNIMVEFFQEPEWRWRMHLQFSPFLRPLRDDPRLAPWFDITTQLSIQDRQGLAAAKT